MSADFVDRFAAWWSAPDPARLDLLLTEDVTLIQPLVPPTQGRAAAAQEFERLFAFLPDLRATVHRWAADGDLVFIEFTLSGTFAGKRVSWDAVDRFYLRGGLASERVSYFDSAPLGIQMAMRPRGWVRLARSGLRPRLPAPPSAPAGG